RTEVQQAGTVRAVPSPNAPKLTNVPAPLSPADRQAKVRALTDEANAQATALIAAGQKTQATMMSVIEAPRTGGDADQKLNDAKRDLVGLATDLESRYKQVTERLTEIEELADSDPALYQE